MEVKKSATQTTILAIKFRELLIGRTTSNVACQCQQIVFAILHLPSLLFAAEYPMIDLAVMPCRGGAIFGPGMRYYFVTTIQSTR
jgi:hypothetical protein